MPENKKFNFKYLLKIIFYFFAILVALYIVLLASGYKFDGFKKVFVQTGSIYINSNPKDVKIYLNGKLKAAKTPFKLGYLLPGNYEVKIEKDGYKSWQKRLTVKQGLVTSESEVILFYSQVKDDDFSSIGGVENLKLNAAKNELLYWSESQIYFQKTDSDQIQNSVLLANGQIVEVDGGLNFEKLLIFKNDPSGQAQTILYCSQKDCPTPVDLNLALSLNFDKGKISNDNSYPLLLSAQGNLYVVADNLTKYYIDSHVLDYVFYAGRVYYLTEGDDGVKLSFSDPKGENKKIITTQKANRNINNFILFVDAKKNRLFLIGEDKNLFQINNNNLSLEDLKTEATALNFDNNNYLLIINGSELKVQGKIELADKEDSFHEVARYSNDPLRAGWILRTNHLISIRDGILKTVEVKGTNETDLYIFDKASVMNFASISKNEVIVLDKSRLKKVTVCEKGSLIDLWQ